MRNRFFSFGLEPIKPAFFNVSGQNVWLFCSKKVKNQAGVELDVGFYPSLNATWWASFISEAPLVLSASVATQTKSFKKIARAAAGFLSVSSSVLRHCERAPTCLLSTFRTLNCSPECLHHKRVYFLPEGRFFLSKLADVDRTLAERTKVRIVHLPLLSFEAKNFNQL